MMTTTMMMTTLASPPTPLTSNLNAPNTLTAFQRTCLIRSTRKIGRVFGSTRIVLELDRSASASASAPRQTRSLDLNNKEKQKQMVMLPIGPGLHHNNSGSVRDSDKRGASSSCSAPGYPTPLSHQTTITTTTSTSIAKVKTKTRALRRQGSLFELPIPIMLHHAHAATDSSYSLDSVYFQSSPDGGVTSERVESVPEADTDTHARGFAERRQQPPQRKANIPAPLALSSKPPTSPSQPLHTSTPSSESSSDLPYMTTRARTPSDMLFPRSPFSSFDDSGSGSGFPTPLTPSFRFCAAAQPEHRRKKLDKLARTLGENIPPSLVFPSSSSSPSSVTHEEGSESAPSTPVPGRYDVDRDRDGDRLLSADSGPGVTTSRQARRRSISTGSLLALQSQSHFQFSSVSLDMPVSSKHGTGDAPTYAKPKAREISRTNAGAKPGHGRGVSRWEPPAEWALGPPPSPLRGTKSMDSAPAPHPTFRVEEVQGTWNADSYDCVMERLRGLRG